MVHVSFQKEIRQKNDLIVVVVRQNADVAVFQYFLISQIQPVFVVFVGFCPHHIHGIIDDQKNNNEHCRNDGGKYDILFKKQRQRRKA